MESITLYYRQGSSDKVYQVSLEPKDGGYAVYYAFGKRGATLSTGTKTPVAVDYATAKAIYDKLVNEKKAKGYTPGEEGTPYQHTEKEERATGLHCQLLNPVDEAEARSLIKDPNWVMQKKWDGRRLILHKQNGEILGINRLGLTVDLPVKLIEDARRCRIDFTVDGEIIGDTLYVFDLLSCDRDDMKECRFVDRYLRLMNLLACFTHPRIHLVETAFKEEDKSLLFERYKVNGDEGVVFKYQHSTYIAGRPSSGGSQLKYKFTETASFVVGKINSKRSITLHLYDGQRTVLAGKVTIPANQEIPTVGKVVEVRYLYAFKESGSIFQPVYLGVRGDIAASECTVSQLKFKPTTPAD